MNRIEIRKHAAGAIVAPAHYLGNAFTAYSTTMRELGAQFSKADNGSLIPIDRVPAIVAALDRLHFHVAVDGELRSAIEDRRAAASAESEEATARAAAVDSALRARGLALFKYQAEGIPWLAPRERAGLFDDMGLGKTIQALTAAPAGAPVLVVCPKNAKYVWLREAAKWRPDLRATVLAGRKSFRWPEPGEMVVVNYDILPGDDSATVAGTGGTRTRASTLEHAPAGTVLIADEAHKLKTPKSIRTVRFRSLSRCARTAGGRVWLLTGTPLLNRPAELWAVLQAADLAADAFGNFNRFVELFGGFKGRFGYEWSCTDSRPCSRCRRGRRDDCTTGTIDPSVPDLLRRVALRRRKVDQLQDLPPKMYETVEFECVDQDLRRICDEIVAALRKRGLDLEDAIEEAIETKNGVAFEAMSRVRSRLAAAKIPALLEWLEQFEENEEPLIVFSRHRGPIDALATRPGWGTITGDQSAEERGRVEEAFQAGRLLGVCATIQAGCEALTLTRSARVVFVDLDWTPALNMQAEDRACRIGQTRGVIVTRIIANHDLDRYVIEALARKQAIISSSVDAAAVVTVGVQDASTLAGVPCTEGNAEPWYAEIPASREWLQMHPPAATDRNGSAVEAQRSAREGAAGTPLDWILVDNVLAMPEPEYRPTNRRRAASTPEEAWAAGALATLAACDTDRAREQNGIGFNRIDNTLGHSLAEQIAIGLTDKQWTVAVKIAMRYPKQVGRP